MENIFQNIPNLGALMGEAKKMEEKIQTMKKELGEKTIESSSGGGMVRVKINGNQELLDIKIDPEVYSSKDYEMLQDLIIAAVNEGVRKSKEMVKQEMSKLTFGLNIPGLSSLL